ncbi:ABC transporter ATP-binding protein [Xylophilus sp. GOD-11R]|uniref:ABC transporter ATP-binding protein n=1 Tax=Xylophilus sp. GOD-11R TaxID=3089814 RepID=UPI00298C5A0D|nr:ABC transporter ATP-binding protein [Xylophilus sp. GOD-11R]WPB57456.1 ABC transporter ATP-binding protein [Xylophilus sp. GOD-11R]
MSNSSDKHLDLWKVSKVYQGKAGPVEAVSDVSLSIREGEFVSILGPSGCGKSTLMMMMAGLEDITEGVIIERGREVTGPRPDVGLIFQDATLLPWLSVLDNVLFPVRILKRPRADYLPRALELLKMTGLSDFAHHRPAQLSGGMRQRASICRALVLDPPLLMMDEPFSALDAITRDEMNFALLDIWQRHPKTGVFITHSIREAVLLSDRVLVMTRRPSTVVCDLTIPFPRPRRPEIVETPEFTAICAQLRSQIEAGYAAEQGNTLRAAAATAATVE